MEWWVILPLGLWVLLQKQRIDALARRIGELELQLFKLREAAPKPAAEAPVAASPQTRAVEEPLLLTEVVPDDVLVLDAPLPNVSNDTNGAARPSVFAGERPRMHSPLLLDEPAPDSVPPAAEPPRAELDAPPQPPRPKRPTRRLDQWLAENGLAWVAGIAIALGAIYLVSLAAQSDWFTPAIQLSLATMLGAACLAGSEWMRRNGLSRPPGHPLMAALMAGAGMVVFYAATWAAHAGFGLINWPAAVALLALCALALIGLSFVHGQAIGVLAIGMALLAPAVANPAGWSSAALTGYLGIVSLGGFVLAGVRRWAWVSLATAAGLYFWFFASIGADDARRPLALLSFASLGGVGMAFRPPLADASKARLAWSAVRDLAPSLAISISSVLLIWAWLVIATAPSGAVIAPALISVFHVALAAYAVRERLATPVSFAITTGALVLGFMAYLRARFPAPVDWSFYPALLLSAVTVIVMALAAHPRRSGRVLVAGAGSIGAALLTAVAASSRPDWHSLAAWAPLLVGSLLLLAAGWRRESDAQDRHRDAALDLWGGGAAALLLLAVEAALPGDWRATGHAALALAFSIGLAWRGWRVLSWAALAAGALSMVQTMAPGATGAALDQPIWIGLLNVALAAALLFAASTVIRRNSPKTGAAEGLSTAAMIVAVTGAMLALRWLATSRGGFALDGFTEASLRVLMLMAAGLVLAPRIHESPGPIGAWRGHVLLSLGLAYVLLLPGLAVNPWWGGTGRAVVNGLPLFNPLALAFLAPAALAFVAARRFYPRNLMLARIYAGFAVALPVLWAVMETRHAFHNPAMAEPAVGLFESACYALIILLFGLAVAVAARMRAARNPNRPFTQDLMRTMRPTAWAAIAFAVFILLIARHPIWGGQDSAASNAFSTLLSVGAQFAGFALALLLGRALSVSTGADPVRFAAASASVLLVWSAGHATIRWLHHRGYMDDGAPLLDLEGLLHAVWPLALVSAAAQLTRLAPGRDTVRAYLYDLQAIWAAAIWPALGLAALGLSLFFNPWWGVLPAQIPTIGAAITVLGLYALAAALSNVAPDVPRVQLMKYLVPAATVLAALHLFVMITLVARWLYHDGEMSAARSGELELWVYSAIWALFGAAALALGTVRNDPVLRWIGLAVFGATIVKVFFLDTMQLSPLVRAASFIGLAIVTGGSAWLARRNRPPPSPGDLVTVTPSARRERRRVRRRTSP
ncbi:MAG: DUF2339 domain-containing protein [Hyphomonadaceae bacterium]